MCEDLSFETYAFRVCVRQLLHLCFISSSSNFKAEIWWESLGLLFISFGSVLEKQQQEQQNPDFVQKAIRLRKFFFSSLIASPATFSRFVGINGGKETAQLVVQS